MHRRTPGERDSRAAALWLPLCASGRLHVGGVWKRGQPGSAGAGFREALPPGHIVGAGAHACLSPGATHALRAARCAPAHSVQSWIEEMSAFLKAQDPNHLVTVGEEGFYGNGRADGQNPQPNSSERRGARARHMCRTCCLAAGQLHPGRRVWGCAAEVVGGHLITQEPVLWPPLLTATDWAPATGQDFIANHRVDSIDYAAFHLWPGAPVGAVFKRRQGRRTKGCARDRNRLARRTACVARLGPSCPSLMGSTLVSLPTSPSLPCAPRINLDNWNVSNDFMQSWIASHEAAARDMNKARASRGGEGMEAWPVLP